MGMGKDIALFGVVTGLIGMLLLMVGIIGISSIFDEKKEMK